MNNNNKLLISMKKSFGKMAVLFSIGIVWYALVAVMEGAYILPGNVLKFFALFMVLAVFTGFRIYLDGSRWTFGFPFFIKNLIAMPFYLTATIICIMSLENVEKNLATLIFVLVVFGITFVISSIICYFIEKSKVEKMNDALLKFKEEHFGEEQ